MKVSLECYRSTGVGHLLWLCVCVCVCMREREREREREWFMEDLLEEGSMI